MTIFSFLYSAEQNIKCKKINEKKMDKSFERKKKHFSIIIIMIIWQQRVKICLFSMTWYFVQQNRHSKMSIFLLSFIHSLLLYLSSWITLFKNDWFEPISLTRSFCCCCCCSIYSLFNSFSKWSFQFFFFWYTFWILRFMGVNNVVHLIFLFPFFPFTIYYHYCWI